MEAPETALTGTEGNRPAPRTLIWIDTREAIIARWVDGETSIDRLESEVPAHRKSTGTVRRQPRHDVGLVSGGYGHPQTSDDRHRIEHLNRFLEQVAARLPAADHLTITGPGTVHERLASLVRDGDLQHHHARPVAVESATRLTDRQLIARVKALAGDLPRRRTVGAYGWTGALGERVSGAPVTTPGRVVKKPPRERIRVETVLEEELAEVPEEARGEPHG